MHSSRHIRFHQQPTQFSWQLLLQLKSSLISWAFKTEDINSCFLCCNSLRNEGTLPESLTDMTGIITKQLLYHCSIWDCFQLNAAKNHLPYLRHVLFWIQKSLWHITMRWTRKLSLHLKTGLLLFFHTVLKMWPATVDK